MEYTNPVVEIIRDGVNNPKIKLKFPEYCSIMEIYKDGVLVNTLTNSRYIITPTFNSRYKWGKGYKNIWIGRKDTIQSIPDIDNIHFLFNDGSPYGNRFTLEIIGDWVQFSMNIKRKDGSIFSMSGGDTYSHTKYDRVWSFGNSSEYEDIHFWRIYDNVTNYIFIKNDGISDEVTYEIQSNGKYTVKCKGIRGLVEDKLFSIDNFTVPFTISLYNNISDNHKLDKVLTNTLTLQGTLRSSSSIIEPEFDIELDSPPTYNYCYIPEFNRYYFINDITAIRTNLWKISCNVDVLMSFKNDIRKLNAYISRQEFKFFDDLVDDKLPLSSDCTIDNINGDFYYVNNLPLFRDLTANSMSDNDYNIIIRTMGLNDAQYQDDLLSPTSNVYVVNYKNIKALTNKLFKPQPIPDSYTDGEFFVNPAKCIRDCVIYPFNVLNYINSGKSTDWLQVSFLGLNVRVDEYPIHQLWDVDISVVPFYIKIDRKYNNFLDYEPYTKLQAYIPFIGVVDIPTKYAYDYERIDIRYNINFGSNECCYELLGVTYFEDIKNYTILQFGQCSVGIPFAIDDPNLYEASRQMQLLKEQRNIDDTKNIFSTIGSAITSFTMMGVGIYTGNPYLTAMGAAGAVSGVTNSVGGLVNSSQNQNKNSLDKSNTIPSLGSNLSNTLYYQLGLRPYIRRITVNPVENFSPSYYAHTMGKPCSGNYMLKDLRGYTEIIGVHISNIPNATSKEQDAIDSLLRKGVIL